VNVQARIQRGVVTGVELPREKSVQKFLGLPFRCTVEHVQLKNVTVDVMIILTITVGVKCTPGCIKMRHFEGENIIFPPALPPPRLTPMRRGYPLPDPTPVGVFGAFIRLPLALDTPLPRANIWLRVCERRRCFQ